MRPSGRSPTRETRTFTFLKECPTPERMARLQNRLDREVLHAEFQDGSRGFRVGTKRSVDVPLRADLVDMIHTQPSHGLSSPDDLNVLRLLIRIGSPLWALKVVAPDGRLYIHDLDDLGRPLRGPGGRLRITVVRPKPGGAS
jgi:hypothetical protein